MHSMSEKFAELPSSKDDSDWFDEEEILDPPNDSLPVASVQKDDFVSPDVELSELNQSLRVLGESPVVKRKVYNQLNYSS